MSASSMSLKAKINNYAKQHRIAPQVVLQNYLFERFLERVSLSEYRDNLVLKGGLLISSKHTKRDSLCCIAGNVNSSRHLG